ARWLEIEVEYPSGEGNWTTLSPRQLVSGTPYALQTRGIFCNDDLEVGIGTTNPSSPLHVRAAEGKAISAQAVAGTGYTAALDAYVASGQGVGVYSFNEAESGNAYAFFGETASPDGIALYGYAFNNDEYSTGIGVYGKSRGDYGGAGVYGEATNTGTNYGVRGVSAYGTGVRGDHQDSGNYGSLGRSSAGVYGRGTGDSTGVHGIAAGTGASDTGRGVHGESTTPNMGIGVHGVWNGDPAQGTGYGGIFETTSSTTPALIGSNSGTAEGAVGVFGVTVNESGESYGVWGKIHSSGGYGVYGEAVSDVGTTFGVVGRSDSGNGRGVYGYAAAAMGTTIGVLGESESNIGVFGVGGESEHDNSSLGGRFISWASQGTGVHGWAPDGGDDKSYGGHFESHSSSGTGAFGHATAYSGENYGVLGASNSPYGYDFYATGTGIDYGAESSIRWKRNIRSISRPLEKLAELRGVYFDWDEEHGGQHDVGMIAEEVGEVLPEIVQYEAKGIYASGMDYSKLTPLLVEALNALRAEKDAEIALRDRRIESLEQNNDRLEARLARLEAIVDDLASRQEVER
ncbi:MAG: tail fiber domain-containing protein, partial [Phycisphaerales bacterium]